MSTNHSPDELLAAAYAVDGPDENRELYARWASTYETGFIVDSQYIYHEQVAEVFHERFPDHPSNDPIVDVGCGTGLGGQALRKLQPVIIDGLDLSPEMLHQASTKGIYRHLLSADLTQTLNIDDDTYAGAISVGTFTHGHVGPGVLLELIRIVRSGGGVALGINASHYAAADFEATFARLGDEGLISTPEIVVAPIYRGADMTNPDEYAHIVVFTVASSLT